MAQGDPESVLRLEHAAVFYWRRTGVFRRRPFWVLNDVTFTVRTGETLGLIGKNGAGKSTLLSLMAGVLAPDKGRVITNGGRTSLLSLQAGFTPHLSGRENAILNGMLLGMRRREVEARMGEIIAFSELEEFIDQPIRTYSAGMKARLGFSVAFQVRPELLLLDEVIGVGDEAFRNKSMAVMKARLRSEQTVVIVSHNLPFIREVCDRVIWIQNGLVKDEGVPDSVLRGYYESMRCDDRHHHSHI